VHKDQLLCGQVIGTTRTFYWFPVQMSTSCRLGIQNRHQKEHLYLHFTSTNCKRQCLFCTAWTKFTET